MDSKSLAQTLHRIAQREVNMDNVGRLILSEAKRDVNIPNLTFEAINGLWQKYYPNEDIDESCGVIRVYFDGKQILKNIRHTRAPINVEMETYPVDNEETFTASKLEVYDQDFPANKPDSQNVIW
jgi:hypothetical protein